MGAWNNSGEEREVEVLWEKTGCLLWDVTQSRHQRATKDFTQPTSLSRYNELLITGASVTSGNLNSETYISVRVWVRLFCAKKTDTWYWKQMPLGVFVQLHIRARLYLLGSTREEKSELTVENRYPCFSFWDKELLECSELSKGCLLAHVSHLRPLNLVSPFFTTLAGGLTRLSILKCIFTTSKNSKGYPFFHICILLSFEARVSGLPIFV